MRRKTRSWGGRSSKEERRGKNKATNNEKERGASVAPFARHTKHTRTHYTATPRSKNAQQQQQAMLKAVQNTHSISEDKLRCTIMSCTLLIVFSRRFVSVAFV